MDISSLTSSKVPHVPHVPHIPHVAKITHIPKTAETTEQILKGTSRRGVKKSSAEPIDDDAVSEDSDDIIRGPLSRLASA